MGAACKTCPAARWASVYRLELFSRSGCLCVRFECRTGVPGPDHPSCAHAARWGPSQERGRRVPWSLLYGAWGIRTVDMFREPLPKGMKVSDCLARYQTGGLRRKPDGRPFEDVIESGENAEKESVKLRRIPVSSRNLFYAKLSTPRCLLAKESYSIPSWGPARRLPRRRLSVIAALVSKEFLTILQ